MVKRIDAEYSANVKSEDINKFRNESIAFDFDQLWDTWDAAHVNARKGLRWVDGGVGQLTDARPL